MNPLNEHDDDRPIGRVLSRREMIGLLAGAGAVLVVGVEAVRGTPVRAAGTAIGQALGPAVPQLTPTALPQCVVRPAETEGPYFVDERLNRSDIRPDVGGQPRPGVLLNLTFLLSAVNAGSCTPLPNVYVDVWHCDALGNYSDVGSYVGHNFLRGYQITDANGMATFTTIYPGWYTGRTVHIHFKIRTSLGAGGYDFTSQLFFDDMLTDQVFTQAPYNTRGPRDTRNANDGIYQNGGSQLLLTLTPDGQGGYVSTFGIGLQGVPVTPVPTSTAVSTSTATQPPGATTTPGATSTAGATNTPGATGTAGPTNTPGATGTPAPCEITFSDVHSGDYFYESVTYLSCNGAISGYGDGTFRPYNTITRAQFVKMLVLSQGWALLNPATPTFSDVPRSDPFYILHFRRNRGRTGCYFGLWQWHVPSQRERHARPDLQSRRPGPRLDVAQSEHAPLQ